MAIKKYDYELSLWNEEIDALGKKIEKKSYIIGSNKMSYLGKAKNIKLKRELKGTNTLSFEMPSKFFDNKKGEFVKNEFIDYLFNEAKIKLFFMNRYYEFYIKNIQENKDFKCINYSYECEDSFINELSRTGYEITFDEELYNNVDEIGNFSEITLEDSVWDYRPDFNFGDFTEYSEQRFYKIPLELFGGKIKGHLINLSVNESDIRNTQWGKDEQGNKKDWADDDYKKSVIENIYTQENRPLEYGDDLSREQRIFYDPYQGEGNTLADNGGALLNGEEILINDEDGYIYVPYTDLSYIYGNFLANSYKSTQSLAIYGSYEDSKSSKIKQYALQPASENPYDLIQFIYFSKEDLIKIDESGIVENMDCHYLIKIEDWNELVKNNFKRKEAIHWEVDVSDFKSDDDKDFFSGTYNYFHDGNIYYTLNVMPETSLTDDFNWYPIYSEGYLDKIGEDEVFGARKISITDRTEFNKKYGSYVKVYNNKSSEYSEKYSELDANGKEAIPDTKGYRVCSKQDTRIILPTLARNLIQNGKNITDTNGWEKRTQKSITEYNTGSYEHLMEIEAKTSTEDNENNVEEAVDDFYLSIISPYLEKCDDLEQEGMVLEDVLLNFGLSSNEVQIDKNKTYGIKIITIEDGVEKINEEFQNIIIGQGSINLEGNYILSGYDTIEQNNYISFEKVNEANLCFLPDGADAKEKIYQKEFYDYNGLSWDINSEKGIEETPYLLFKTDRTITNPYVGLKIKSKPLTLNLDNINVETLSINDGKGITIAVRGYKENGGAYYVDGVKIGINPFTTNYYSDEWIAKAEAYRDGSDISTEKTDAIDGNLGDDFKDFQSVKPNRSSYSFKATSSSKNKITFTAAALADNDNDTKSCIYALYLDDNFYGIFWLTRNSNQEDDIQENSLKIRGNYLSPIRKASLYTNEINGPTYSITKQNLRYSKTVSWNGKKWTEKYTSNYKLPKYLISAESKSDDSFRRLAYGFTDKKEYNSLTKERFISCSSHNGLSKGVKIATSVNDNYNTVFSLDYLNMKTHVNACYKNDYFWFSGETEREVWAKVPCAFYNYYYYNMAANNLKFQERLFKFDNGNYLSLKKASDLSKALFNSLNTKTTINREGFYWGIGYLDQNGKPKIGNYYLVIKRTQSYDGNSYGTTICAGGDKTRVLNSLSSYLANNASSTQGKINNAYLISCQTTGEYPSDKIENAPYYKILSGIGAITGGQTLTYDKVKNLISENTTSSDSSYNDGGSTSSGSSYSDYYNEPIRDDRGIVSPEYITNYNLYDLHFRAYTYSPAKDKLKTRNIDNINSIITLNLSSVEEGQTISNVKTILDTINTETNTAEVFFNQIDTLLNENLVPGTIPPGNLKDWYIIPYKVLVIKRNIFDDSLTYDQMKEKAKGDLISLSKFFTLDIYERAGDNGYKLAFYKNNKYENITITEFLSTFNEVVSLAKNKKFNITIKLTQEPTTLNIRSFELFEAYTRGRDFVEYNYTSLRSNEEAYRINNNYGREIFKDKNYFSYKYCGREFDLNNFISTPHYLAETQIKLGVAHEKDLLTETDITLGQTYTYNNYFIEAIKYKKSDKYIYKDTFMIKDYVKAIDDTKYTEDDIEIITDQIDLLQCDYYYPQDATYENQWCDCRFKDKNNIAKRECLYEKMGICPYLFQTEKHPRKIRTLSEEKSNRFNIIQNISKVFKCYPQFYIEFDENGKVLLDKDGNMKKHVFYITEKGKNNDFGFRYEKNLKTINRSIDSSAITTRLFVENIDSDLSPTGLCSIQTAEDNIGRNSYIFDFSYYIMKNLLDREQVERDLYGINLKTDLAFLPTIGYYNKKYDDLTNLITNVTNETMTNLQAENIVKIEGITTALEERKKIANIMYQFKVKAETSTTDEDYTTSDTYVNYLTKYKEYASIIWGNMEALLFSKNLIYYNEKIYNLDDENENSPTSLISILKDRMKDYPQIPYNLIYSYLKNKYCNGELIWRIYFEGFDQDDIKYCKELSSYIPLYETWLYFKENILDKHLYFTCGLIGQYQSLYDQVKLWRKTKAKYLNKINDLVSVFYKKYEPFIKEGTYSDDNYLTDNEYYWAAVSVLNDSCKPDVSYQINVIDLAPIYGDDYNFELADTTFIEDIDFFGVNETTGLPNRQKVLISAIDYDLDNPSQNNITIQNYTTQFDDLFQQISASVQSLTFNENTYKRASNFKPTHIIDEDSLQGTLTSGDFTLVNSNNENVVIDENGAAGKDINNSASQYKLTGEGLYFSKDGGQTWDIGVGPSGINADYIKAGQIDSSKIQIMDSGYIYFLWDKSGITAYRNPATSTSGLVDFTRFNKYGLSLIENNNIRLRAGYEFRTATQDANSYNTTGNYKEEVELSNQNIGFYLYNDSGIPIFKTETQSSFKNADADYSARLSMTGEMYITNDVLSGQNDGSAIFQRVIYNVSGANLIKQDSANNLVLQEENSTENYTIEGREFAFLYAGENKTNVENEVYFNKYSVLDDYYFVEKQGKNEFIIFENIENNKKYLKIYDLSVNELSQDSSSYYILNEKIYEHTNNDETNSIYLLRQNRNYALIELKDEYQLLTDGNYDYNKIDKFLEENLKNLIPELLFEISYINYQKIKEQDNNFYEIVGSTSINVLTASVPEAKVSIGAGTAELQEVEYYDCSSDKIYGVSSQKNSFYRIDANYQTIIYNYWNKAEATDEIETTDSTGIKTQTVGVFINNKNLSSEKTSDYLELSEEETDIQKISSVIGSGSERIFTVCLKGENLDNNTTVYKNIFSVLKNGCAYFGGEIKNANKSNLDIENMDYLPDEISIIDPSMIIANNGTVISDWEQMYDFQKTNGHITAISTQSLGELLSKLDAGIISGGTTDTNGITTSGYYIADPLA